ncbi:MAG: HTH domain-containing protein [Saprospiraceae bacterium]|nr:HTH domain-containing protein [Saprospiraceae bacterium]
MKGNVPVRVKRVLTLIQKLMQFPPKRIDALAERLNVSKSTIYKDIEVVRSIGMPLERDSRRRYYFSGTPEKSSGFYPWREERDHFCSKTRRIISCTSEQTEVKTGLGDIGGYTRIRTCGASGEHAPDSIPCCGGKECSIVACIQICKCGQFEPRQGRDSPLP